MKKLTVIGLFCGDQDVADGQSIKTRIVFREFEKSLGVEQIRKIDTFGWKKHPFRLFYRSVKAVQDSQNVVFMTDAGGIKVFPWLLTCANIFKKRPIHYIVIGGWLIGYAEKHKLSARFLKKLSGIFVETQVMRRGLERLGFDNVFVMPNFKDLSVLTEDQLSAPAGEPYRFSIFSRIMREKGIETAVNAVRNINLQYGRRVCTLDLYGQVDRNQTEWFEQLKQDFPDAVRYGGVIPYDQSVSVLKDYYALLFPTEFYTEGIPGTIVDAYAAGIPVIASEWESVQDIVDAGKTGVTYPFDRPEALQTCMIELMESPALAWEMKKHCLAKAGQYLPDAVMDGFLSKLV